MLLIDRERAPKGAPALTLLWPVTLFRVELTTRAAEDEADPLRLLLLDLAVADVTDPERVAALTGLSASFVRELQVALTLEGLLEEGSRGLTDRGRARRDGVPEEVEYSGWMARDDVTGEALPFFWSRHPRTGLSEDGAVKLPPLHREGKPDQGFRVALGRAFAQDRRLRKVSGQRALPADVDPVLEEDEGPDRGRVRLLDSGSWQELRVDLWAEVDPLLHGDDGFKLVAGCPFNRPGAGLRYLTRLRGHPGGVGVLQDLQSRAQEARNRQVAELADGLLLREIEAELDAVLFCVAAPADLRRDLREALVHRARARQGRSLPRTALVDYGRIAENILVELAPRERERPDRARVDRLLQTLPEDSRTRGQLLRAAIEREAPPGVGVPRHLHAECERFVATLASQKRLPARGRVGTTRQLLPFAAAGAFPEGPQARRLGEVWARCPSLWGDLCRAIDRRNPAAHGSTEVDSDARIAEELAFLEASHADISRVIAAVWPREGAPPAVPEPPPSPEAPVEAPSLVEAPPPDGRDAWADEDATPW